MFPRYRDMTTRPAGNDISSKTGSNFLHSCISTFTVDVWFASTLVFTISFRKFNCNLGNLFLLFWVLDPTEKGFFFFFYNRKVWRRYSNIDFLLFAPPFGFRHHFPLGVIPVHWQFESMPIIICLEPHSSFI